MRIITGTERGRKLITPEGLDVRPTSDMAKEAIFSIIQNEVEGAVFLDLFAGSGQMGIEALSRGAKQAVFIDSSRVSIECIKENTKNAKFFSKCRVALMEAKSFLQGTKDEFDIAFLDPPYNKQIIDDVLPLVAQKMAQKGSILCETERNEVLPEEAGEFKIFKEYNYGKTKVTLYRRGDKQ